MKVTTLLFFLGLSGLIWALQVEDMKQSDPNHVIPGLKVTKAELGTHGWALLHAIAAKYPIDPTPEDKKRMLKFLTLFADLYPCEECGLHLKRYYKKHPVDLRGRDELANYMCVLHNVLNKFLKKPMFDCSKLNEKYGGECDECKPDPSFRLDF